MADAAARNPNTHRRQSGWIGTAAALVGLVLAGFLGGALIGFLWDEPRLVMAYLTGETDEVQWSEPERMAPEEPGSGDVAAAPLAEPAPRAEVEPKEESETGPAPAKREVAAAEPAPVPKPEPAPAARPAAPDPEPAAAAGSGRFAVQVGAFSENASAERLVARLRQGGYEAYIAPAPSGAARWRVRVGPVPTRPEAEALAAKLSKGESLSTWVLDENAS